MTIRDTVKTALEDIAFERQRQVEVEGWTPEHDDEHVDFSLTQAAVTYALGAALADQAERAVMDTFCDASGTPYHIHSHWPESWHIAWFKPRGRRHDLVKAGALIVAEIERLDRATPKGDRDLSEGEG